MFQILTRFSKFQLKLAYKLNKPFQVIWGPIQAQDGMGEVNQWSCGCVVSNFEWVSNFGAMPAKSACWMDLNTASHSHFFTLCCRRKLFIHLICTLLGT